MSWRESGVSPTSAAHVALLALSSVPLQLQLLPPCLARQCCAGVHACCWDTRCGSTSPTLPRFMLTLMKNTPSDDGGGGERAAGG